MRMITKRRRLRHGASTVHTVAGMGVALSVREQALAPYRARDDSRAPLKVGVLVDLVLAPGAGGHVKCWERLAEAAVECPDQLDLTVHFSGSVEERIELSPSVRYVVMPPVFSTSRLIRNVPDHTDLAPWHPRLARTLPRYDVIHTTDAFFCYARTASRVARRHGLPLVSSIHTNTPEYAQITISHLLERLLGDGVACRVVRDRLGVPNWGRRWLERRLYRHLDGVTMAMAGYGDGLEEKFGNWHCGVVLRRGLDHELFSPARRDRAWFETRFGVPPGHFVVMYAGKLNNGKNVPLLAAAIAKARESGLPIHLFCAGSGDQHAVLEARLGAAVTLPGTLNQAELARAYASVDLFAFPSMIDEYGNVAVEALACGSPTLLAAGNGVAARMGDCPAITVLPGDQPEAWAAAIVELARQPEKARDLGEQGHAYVRAQVPSWREVVREDLIPVWRAALAARRMM
jgi:glycosyltransferase involved in cell wall biosynthesis